MVALAISQVLKSHTWPVPSTDSTAADTPPLGTDKGLPGRGGQRSLEKHIRPGENARGATAHYHPLFPYTVFPKAL